jgi:hypothetical protein
MSRGKFATKPSLTGVSGAHEREPGPFAVWKVLLRFGDHPLCAPALFVAVAPTVRSRAPFHRPSCGPNDPRPFAAWSPATGRFHDDDGHTRLCSRGRTFRNDHPGPRSGAPSSTQPPSSHDRSLPIGAGRAAPGRPIWRGNSRPGGVAKHNQGTPVLLWCARVRDPEAVEVVRVQLAVRPLSMV